MQFFCHKLILVIRKDDSRRVSSDWMYILAVFISFHFILFFFQNQFPSVPFYKKEGHLFRHQDVARMFADVESLVILSQS